MHGAWLPSLTTSTLGFLQACVAEMPFAPRCSHLYILCTLGALHILSANARDNGTTTQIHLLRSHICRSSRELTQSYCNCAGCQQITAKAVSGKQRHNFAVAALFKNEAHALREWCQHYIDEKVNHIFLIDNGSTDDYLKEIKPFIATGKVTLLTDSTPYDQDAIYFRQLTMYLPVVKWMAILDLDEFLYARNGTIGSYLHSLGDDVGAIRLGWKQYGSSGLTTQPESIIHSFIQRAPFTNDNINIKSIFRCRAAVHLQMHATTIAHQYQDVLPYQPPRSRGSEKGEDTLRQHQLHLNHYQLQSKDWFMRVKSTRGSATNPEENKLRDENYFDVSDRAYTGILDDELRTKKKSLF